MNIGSVGAGQQSFYLVVLTKLWKPTGVWPLLLTDVRVFLLSLVLVSSRAHPWPSILHWCQTRALMSLCLSTPWAQSWRWNLWITCRSEFSFTHSLLISCWFSFMCKMIYLQLLIRHCYNKIPMYRGVFSLQFSRCKNMVSTFNLARALWLPFTLHRLW